MVSWHLIWTQTISSLNVARRLRTFICRLHEFVDPKPGMHHLDSFGISLWACPHMNPPKFPEIGSHIFLCFGLFGWLSRCLQTILVLKTAGLSGGPTHVSMPIRHQVLKSSGGEHWSSESFYFGVEGGGRARHKFTK